MADFVGVFAIFCTFSFPVAIVWIIMKAGDRKQELEMRLKLQETQPQLPANESELKSLREELASFKDMSTRYDMTIDQALERLEQRIDHIENKTFRPNIPAEPESTQTLGRRD